MTSRVFVVLVLIAVAASALAGLIVDRYTQPGFERTVGFGLILALILFPIGWWMERRGYIRGGVDLRKASARRPAAPAPGSPAGAPGANGATADAGPAAAAARPAVAHETQNATKNEMPAETSGGTK